jgi:hypothetical protein
MAFVWFRVSGKKPWFLFLRFTQLEVVGRMNDWNEDLRLGKDEKRRFLWLKDKFSVFKKPQG